MSGQNKTTTFTKDSGIVAIAPPSSESLNSLEKKNYVLIQPEFKPMMLKEHEGFVMPDKIYGDVDFLTDRVLKTFKNTNKNLGVLLSGLKGTGKTVQMKYLAKEADLPVIIIDTPFSGQSIMSFLDDVGESCVVVFDEFEKTYRAQEHQESILPLLDGISAGKHIFLFTTNESVSQYFIDRPSRIRYNISYEGLDDDTIQEIINDKLIHPKLNEEVFNSMSLIRDKTMDIVCSLIEEVNIHEEVPSNFMRIFNLSDPTDQDFDLKSLVEIPFVAKGVDMVKFLETLKEFLGKKYDNSKTGEAEALIKQVISGDDTAVDPATAKMRWINNRVNQMRNSDYYMNQSASHKFVRDNWDEFIQENPSLIEMEEIGLTVEDQNLRDIMDQTQHDKTTSFWQRGPSYLPSDDKDRCLVNIVDRGWDVHLKNYGFSVEKSGKGLILEFPESNQKFYASPKAYKSYSYGV